jgi:hypothetical protein
MTTLKIGGLSDERPVKVSVELPASVYRDLLAYADNLNGQHVSAAFREGVRRMADLKLGRLPKFGLVSMTIGIPEPLKEELDRYAAEHSRLKEPVDAAT